MRYQKIIFTDNINSRHSKLGGLPWIDNTTLWPCDIETDSFLVLLLTIESNFLVKLYPEFVLPDDCCVSVYVGFDPSSRKCVRRLAITEQVETNKIKSLPSKVILHKKSAVPCKAPFGVPVITEIGMLVNDVEIEEIDQDAPDRGTIFSKLGGIPGWAQDPVDIPDYQYVLQISESDFWTKSRTHAGILGGDTGFLFLRNTIKLGEIGVFFIQFS